MTDSGSEGLGFESQRDHERLKGFKEKSLLLTLWSLLRFCRMAGASLQGYAIPTGSRKIERFQREKLTFNSLEPFFKSIGASI